MYHLVCTEMGSRALQALPSSLLMTKQHLIGKTDQFDKAAGQQIHNRLSIITMSSEGLPAGPVQYCPNCHQLFIKPACESYQIIPHCSLRQDLQPPIHKQNWPSCFQAVGFKTLPVLLQDLLEERMYLHTRTLPDGHDSVQSRVQ